MLLKKKSKIFIAGHKGMVGSAIFRKLKKKGYKKIIVAEKKDLDLLNQDKTLKFFKKHKFSHVILAAAKVGGILANKNFKGDFIYENTTIQSNVIFSSMKTNVRKLVFLGSSCIYPKFAKQPIREEYLLDGKLEETNDAYAIAKINGIKMCQSFNEQYGTEYISLMPSNLYGINDNYDYKNSHVFASLIKKIHDLKKIKAKNKILKLWGTGKARREFLFVDDLADACILVMKKKVINDLINVGLGYDYTIKQIAQIILKTLNVEAKIFFDKSKPDGTPRKLLNISIIKKLGWRPKTTLKQGIKITYENFLTRYEKSS
jgi:GDP-L-fucose synthase